MKYVPGMGGIGAKFMILGEAPGREETHSGKPFVGASGRELDRLLIDAGFIAVRNLLPAQRFDEAAIVPAFRPVGLGSGIKLTVRQQSDLLGRRAGDGDSSAVKLQREGRRHHRGQRPHG